MLQDLMEIYDMRDVVATVRGILELLVIRTRICPFCALQFDEDEEFISHMTGEELRKGNKNDAVKIAAVIDILEYILTIQELENNIFGD